MKEQTQKKQRKWLLPVLALVAVLAVVGVVLAVVGQGWNRAANPQQTDPQDEVKIYWNVEREKYVASGANGYSARSPRSDGYFYVRFAVDGEQVDLPVADAVLATKIDMQKAMGLTFDENGIVVDVLPVHTFTGGTVAENLYVESVDGNTVVANSHMGNQGVSVTVTLEENTKIYNGSSDTALAGMACGVSEGDAIYPIYNLDGSVGWVYVDPYIPPGDIYWNIFRKYDSVAKTTTRERDALGFYTFEMAVNGEVKTLQTRDLEIATKVDSFVAKCMGLEFDEDGYIIDAVGTSARGCPGPFGSWTRVTSIEGRNITTLKLSGSTAGTVWDGVLSKDCKIIDVSSNSDYSGAYTDIRYGDEIHGLYDKRGQVCYVFVISRLGDWPVYWNVERQYDSASKTTKRTPAADGYYYIQVATNGQQMTVRTKDKETATALDAYAARCFGMELEGDEIKRLHAATSVHGGGTFGSWYYVDKIEGSKVTVKRILDGDTVPTYKTGTMTEDVEIINGSNNYISHCGEYTELQVGDRVHGLTDLNGDIRVLFVVERPVDGPVYWNVTRMYKDGASTRKRAEDGYFYFTMAADGKQVTLKTKDQKICNQVDSYAAQCMGLKLNGDVITKVVAATAVKGLSGGTKSLSWVDVTSISGSSFQAQKNQSGHKDNGKVFHDTMAGDCKVYNVSSGYVKFCGEETNLRVGDRIHALHDADGRAKVIFVVDKRAKELDTQPDTCPCSLNVTWEPWDGTTELVNGKYYYLTQDVTAPAEGFVLENMQVNLRLDGHTISSPGRCFYLKAGGQLNICDHETRGKLIGAGVAGESGGVIRVYTASNDAYLKLWNVDLEAQTPNDAKPKEGGIISASGPVALHNVNLRGGNVSARGGAVLVNPTGSLRMFGGSMENCTAATGGNMYVNNGTVYLDGAAFSGGKASKGDQISINTEKQVQFKDITVTSSSKNSVDLSKGSLELLGKITIPGLAIGGDGVLVDCGLDGTSAIGVSGGEQVILTGAKSDLSGVFKPLEEDEYGLVYDPAAGTLSLKNIVVPVPHAADHCLCNGAVTGDHTCATLTGWTKITADVFETAVGTDGKTAGIKFIQDGNYYLETGYKLSGTLCIMPGQNINICLNGNKLSSSGRLGLVAGNLNITDCRSGGKVTGGGTSNGVTLKLVAGGKVNLFAGTLTSSGVNGTDGGVVVISTDKGNITADTTASAFTMYGGTVTGGKANNGGNIHIYHANCAFTMYGGTVSNGTAAKGGNINTGHGKAVVKLLGGTITGGTADVGGGIYAAGTVTLGGSVNLSGNQGTDLYLVSSAATLENYTPTGICVVGMGAPGTFAHYGQDLSAFFTSADSAYKVQYVGGALFLASVNATHDAHCICGGVNTDHTCGPTSWEPWDGTTELTNGSYYLTQDVTFSQLTEKSGIYMESGNLDALNLCLNGHKLIAPEDGRIARIKSTATLNITDCTGTGVLEAGGVAGEGGGVIRSGTGSGVVGLYNITLRRTDNKTTQVTEGGIVTSSGTLNAYKCTFENGYAGKCGGILVAAAGNATLVDCVIRDCESYSNDGGNLYVGGNQSASKWRVTLRNTTITGGKASSGKHGGDVYVAGASTNGMELQGKITIGDLYMLGTGNVRIGTAGLDSTSSIGLTMKTAGIIGTAPSDVSACFTVTNSGCSVSYDGTNLVCSDGAVTPPNPPAPTTHEAHCVCGGHGAGADTTHVCDSSVEWTAWTETTTLPSDDGYYYLTGNVSTSARHNMGSGGTAVDITICLNGYTITGSDRVFGLYTGSLTITDCRDTGKVTSSKATSEGGLIYLLNNKSNPTVFNLYAGTLESTGSVTGSGGVIIMGNGQSQDVTLNMYGGIITGGSAAANGGAIFLNTRNTHKQTVNMYGGTITGNEVTGASGFGGAISVRASTAAYGYINLYGGTITGNTAAMGSDLYGNVIPKLSGEVKVGDLYLLEGNKLDVSGLTGEAQIGITMAVPGVFAENVATDLSACFTSNLANYEITYSAQDQTLALTEKVVPPHQDHCICAEKAKDLGTHTQCETLTGWVEITDAVFETATGTNNSTVGKKFKTDGNYYLNNDYALTSTICIMPGQSINICLNGYTLSSSARLFYVGGQLNITDCKETGTAKSSATGNGAGMKLVAGGICNLYAGTLTQENQTITGGGLVVVSTDKGSITADTNPSVFTMYGGTITGGKTSSHGGNVTIFHADCAFIMYAGTVSNGSAASGNGGNICANNAGSILNLLGGTVTGGSAKTGNDVYAKAGVSIDLGGDVKITDLYLLADQVLGDLSTLTDGAQIGITMAAGSGTFAEDVETNLSGFFTSTNSEYSPAWYNQKLILAAG